MPWRKGHRVQLVSEADADIRTREIFSEIQHVLGVPYTAVVFQAYAAYPTFLELHWSAIRPVLNTHEFFDLAARLRADAYTRMHNYFTVPDLASHMEDLGYSEGARDEIAAETELFSYYHSLLLLILAAQLLSFENPVGTPRPVTVPEERQEFTSAPCFVGDEQISPRVRLIFEEMRRVLPLPFISSDARAFARWPDFLQVYWQSLRPLLQSAMYENSHYGLRDSAFGLARELPGTIDVSAAQLTDVGIPSEEVASLVRLTDQFVSAATALLLNISFVKIGLEGGNAKPVRKLPPQREEEFRLPKAQ